MGRKNKYKPKEVQEVAPAPPAPAPSVSNASQCRAPSQRPSSSGLSGQQAGRVQEPFGGQAGGSSQQLQSPQVGGQLQQRPQDVGAVGGGDWQQHRSQDGRGDGQWQQRSQGGGQEQWRHQGYGAAGGGGGQQQQRPQGGRGDGQWQQRPTGYSAGGGGQQMRGGGAVPKAKSQYHQIAKMSSNGIPRGILGIPGLVEVNYVQMNMSKMPRTAYHYDVTVTPDHPRRFMRPVIEQFNKEVFQSIPMAYDGRQTIYTIVKLPVKEVERDLDILDSAGRTMSFRVEIKETECLEIDLGSLHWYQKERIYDKPMRALQCLEVLMATPCHSKGVRSGRSYYTKPSELYDLKDGYQMWTGLFQAAILGDEPFLNVDIAHKSFPNESTVLDYLKEHFRMDNFNEELSPRIADGLRDFLKSIMIVYEPPVSFKSAPKSYRVNDLTKESAANLFFKNDKNADISVAEYFASNGFKLRYPHLNCVHVGARDRTNYLPIELLRVPSAQALMKKDGSRQVQQMIRYAATTTDERKTKIMRMMALYNHNCDETIRQFGIQIGATFIEVPMRLLKPPHLEYFAGQTILPFNGAWRVNDTTKFLVTQQPDEKHKWAIIYSGRSRTSIFLIGKFGEMILKMATKLNVSLQPKPEITPFARVDDTLREMKADKFDLVFVVVPTNGTTYAEIKQSAELKHGILTQCIKEATLERRLDDQLVLNLMLKVNSKLNGINHRIAPNPIIKQQNIMLIGADVTHPAPEQKEMPSVVGVSATHDELGACYNIQYRIQPSTVEIIEDMDSIVTHHLRFYFRHQKRYPAQIIYYRDGVSDGQFPTVKKSELTGIRAACNRLRIKPKLTCIIVVKRHHTRFFPKTSADRMNKFNNVVPGTVVDQVIVHPNEMQFFLVSHQSIQGTAKPTRYNVILDEAKMNIDVIQTLTHYLCHMFPRCNRAVSYPAPAYLAHLVAFRGRVYLEGMKIAEGTQLSMVYARRTINENFLRSNPMYFV